MCIIKEFQSTVLQADPLRRRCKEGINHSSNDW